MNEGPSRDTAHGHTFVVHGRLEHLIWNAAIIPTDREFRVEPHWEPITGNNPSELRPAGWGDQPFGPAPGRADSKRHVWFLNVDAMRETNPVTALMDRLIEALIAIAASVSGPTDGRVLPLVAIPLIGTKYGGLVTETGIVIRELLTTIRSFTDSHPIDIAVVAVRRSAFAALQSQRHQLDWFDNVLPKQLGTIASELGARAADGNLGLLIGAGVSIPAGLPSWTQLLDKLKARAMGSDVELSGDQFAKLSVLDQAGLIQRVLGTEFFAAVKDAIGPINRPALGHVLLAGLRPGEVVTTNYDNCFELAIRAQGEQISVLPWSQPVPDRPWILKLHGDLSDPNSVVLTRGQFIDYDTSWRPAGSLFQSVLLRRHLLVVGASLTDDNVLRLTHEVTQFRKRHGVTEPVGVVLGLGEDPIRQWLWEGDLTWIGIDGVDLSHQARQLEVVLDAVAMHACRDVSFLLNKDYAGLLDEPSRMLADRLRSIAAELEEYPDDNQRWTPVIKALREWGA